MAVKVAPEVTQIEVIHFENNYWNKLQNMFVEKIEINEQSCVYKKWPTTHYEMSDNIPRIKMDYAF